jgi:hypothetical protein
LLKNLWPTLAKGAVGLLIGIGLWFAFSPPYARVLAWLSEPLIRITERPRVTRLIPAGTEMTIDRTDFPRESPRPALRLMDLTFNIMLLTALFAVSYQPFGNRNISGLLLASLVLAMVHAAAVIVNVQSIYALKLGPWSAQHYGAVARNFWGAAAHFYSVVGSFGAPFALWWLLRPPPVSKTQKLPHRHK